MLTPAGDLYDLASPEEEPICYKTQEYGMHELLVRTVDGQVLSSRFMVCSPLGEFAEALDHFHDAHDWVWDGAWTDELEAATVGMLVALDEQFEAMGSSNSMLGGMLEPSRRRVEKHMAK
eukprot:6100177-Amphidinium_carterae.1